MGKKRLETNVLNLCNNRQFKLKNNQIKASIATVILGNKKKIISV